MTENEIAKQIIGTAIHVHKTLGPGLLENAYETCLCHLLCKRSIQVERQKPIPLIFEEVRLDCGYRIDMLVNRKVVVEIKCVETLNNVHMAQTLTYLKLGGYKLGLLINFNVVTLKSGIKRVIYGAL